MEAFTLIPSRIGVGTHQHGARKVGLLRVVGSGSTAHIGIDMLIDLAALGELEAALGELRTKLVVEKLAHR